MSKNVVTLKSGSEVSQGHWKWYHWLDRVWFPISVIYFFHKTHRFWDIRLVSIHWPWNPDLRSFKVIEDDTIGSGTHDFLLMFHSKHWLISHRFRDKRRFPVKIANFSHPRVFNAPAEGVPLGIGYRRWGQTKLEWWATRWSKKF